MEEYSCLQRESDGNCQETFLCFSYKVPDDLPSCHNILGVGMQIRLLPPHSLNLCLWKLILLELEGASEITHAFPFIVEKLRTSDR